VCELRLQSADKLEAVEGEELAAGGLVEHLGAHRLLDVRHVPRHRGRNEIDRFARQCVVARAVQRSLVGSLASALVQRLASNHLLLKKVRHLRIQRMCACCSVVFRRYR